MRTAILTATNKTMHAYPIDFIHTHTHKLAKRTHLYAHTHTHRYSHTHTHRSFPPNSRLLISCVSIFGVCMQTLTSITNIFDTKRITTTIEHTQTHTLTQLDIGVRVLEIR